MKKRNLLVCSLLLVLAIWEFPAGQSQEDVSPVTVRVTASPGTITVGTHFQFEVEASYNKDTVVQMPGPDTALGEFELIDHHYAPLSEDQNGKIVARSVFTLTSFSTGELEIPAIALSYRVTGGEEESVQTEPVVVTVESVLAAEAEDIKDIKPPFEIPRDWYTLLLAFALGAALMTVALILWRRRNRRVRRDTAKADPEVPPHIEALRALNRLGNSGLLDRGEIVRFHVEASEIIRRYFARRFGIDALEKTSEEILASLPREVSQSLPRDLLRQCDLVKFAKFSPVRSQSEGILELAHEIVETTKQRLESRPPSEQTQNLDLGKTEVGSAGGS